MATASSPGASPLQRPVLKNVRSIYAAKRTPRALGHPQRAPSPTRPIEVFVTGTVPVIVSLGAFLFAFLRSNRNQNSLVFAVNCRLFGGSGGERSIQLSYAS